MWIQNLGVNRVWPAQPGWPADLASSMCPWFSECKVSIRVDLLVDETCESLICLHFAIKTFCPEPPHGGVNISPHPPPPPHTHAHAHTFHNFHSTQLDTERRLEAVIQEIGSVRMTLRNHHALRKWLSIRLLYLEIKLTNKLSITVQRDIVHVQQLFNCRQWDWHV